MPVTTDLWNGTGDWNLNPADWSAGAPPTASTPAEIQSGNCTITASSTAQTLAIDQFAELFLAVDANISLTVTSGLSNEGELVVWDGDTLTIGGTLTNSSGGTNPGVIQIGEPGLDAPATVTATSLNNTGQLLLLGSATAKASLILSGAAPKTLTAGWLRLFPDATIQYGSGEITTIASAATLDLWENSQILTNGGASSALANLTANSGTLRLFGGGIGGGETLTTTKSFTNHGTVDVDAAVSGQSVGGGGSTVTVGGTLTNDNSLNIGNTILNAATTVTANALHNSGTIALNGSSSFLAELVVNGAATTDGVVTIGAGAEIDVTGSHAFTQTGGSTTVTGSLLAGTINANGGVLDFQNAITSGDGVGALDIGALGTLEFDAAVDATHSVHFGTAGGTLELGDAGDFHGKVSHFAVSDAIDLLSQGITGLAYSGSKTSGVLTVTGSGGTIAQLSFAGDYTTSSFKLAPDGHNGTDILHA